MSSLETTELKLKTTPTGGVDASHSPYYRRLLSAGYKGFLQGTLGGASLYGIIGLVIGGLAAAPFIGTLGIAGVLSLAAAAGGVGVLKGASTFGNIGSTAAINAESADLSEQRRYLLDRYYDLPEGPEGDREAEAIKQELMREYEGHHKPPHVFHWKTVAICAGIGALLAAAFMTGGTSLIGHAGILSYIEPLAHTLGLASATPVMLGIGTMLGALTGAVIGIDRYYIRKWFDHTEGVIHSSSHKESALIERAQQVERIKEAAQSSAKETPAIDPIKPFVTLRENDAPAYASNVASAKTLSPTPVAEVAPTKPASPKPLATQLDKAGDRPSTRIAAQSVALDSRLREINAAMQVPAI